MHGAAGPPPAFGSPEMFGLVGHAPAGCAGLAYGSTSPWAAAWSYGGAHVPPGLAAQQLWRDERPVGPAAQGPQLGKRWPQEQLVAAYVAEGAPEEPIDLVGEGARAPALRDEPAHRRRRTRQPEEAPSRDRHPTTRSGTERAPVRSRRVVGDISSPVRRRGGQGRDRIVMMAGGMALSGTCAMVAFLS